MPTLRPCVNGSNTSTTPIGPASPPSGVTMCGIAGWYAGRLRSFLMDGEVTCRRLVCCRSRGRDGLASFHRLDGALGLVAAAWQLGLRTSVAPKRPELRGAATG